MGKFQVVMSDVVTCSALSFWKWFQLVNARSSSLPYWNNSLHEDPWNSFPTSCWGGAWILLCFSEYIWYNHHSVSQRMIIWLRALLCWHCSAWFFSDALSSGLWREHWTAFLQHWHQSQYNAMWTLFTSKGCLWERVAIIHTADL